MKTAIKNVKSLSPLCDVAVKAYDEKRNITAVELQEAKVSESYDGLLKNATHIYDLAILVIELRRKNGISDAKALADTDELFHLDDTQRDLKKSLDLWYSAFGKRNPRTEKGADRPLYSITNSDYVQVGYLCHQAEAEVGADTAKLHDTFLKLMVWSTARILKGEPMGTIPEKDLKAAEKANRDAMSERAKKAAETRKANEQAKAEAARKQREEEKRVKTMEARLAKMESEAISVAKVIAMVQASHATEDEKTAIINALTENSAPKVTELIDDGKAHTENTAA